MRQRIHPGRTKQKIKSAQNRIIAREGQLERESIARARALKEEELAKRKNRVLKLATRATLAARSRSR